jgi:hypothetical protein
MNKYTIPLNLTSGDLASDLRRTYDYGVVWKPGFLLLAMPLLVSACECVDVGTERAKAAAEVVFDGVATDIQYLDPPELRRNLSRVVVTFSVSRKWKGPVKTRIQVHDLEVSLMCDSYSFELGHEYIVYATLMNKDVAGFGNLYPTGTTILSTGACMRIREDIDVERKNLGAGQKPDSD